MLGVIGVWAIVVSRLGPNWIQDVALIAAGLIATLGFVWWTRSTQNFAQRNPSQAMTEGSQWVDFQRYEMQAKGFPQLGFSPLTRNPEAPDVQAVPGSADVEG